MVNFSNNTFSTLKKLLNQKLFKKILIISGKKSYFASGAEKLIKKTLKDKETYLLLKKNKEERFLIIMMLAPMMAVLISFYLYPTFYNLYNSFTDLSLLGLKKGGAYIGFDNYIRLFQDKAFGRLLWNTFFWLTFVSVSLRLVFGILLALLLIIIYNFF